MYVVTEAKHTTIFSLRQARYSNPAAAKLPGLIRALIRTSHTYFLSPRYNSICLMRARTRIKLFCAGFCCLLLFTVSVEYLNTEVDVGTNASKETVSLNMLASEYVTGERISSFADVAIYEESYALQFPAMSEHAKRIIYLNDPLLEQSLSREIVLKSQIFFTRVDWLQYFIDKVLFVLERDFVLITHMSDMQAGKLDNLLNHPRLIKWYGCNMAPSRKTASLPLGLENPGMWNRTDFQHIFETREFGHKTRLLYTYFDVDTNTEKRMSALHALQRNGFSTSGKRLSWKEYISQLVTYKFCACPQGNGIDTHRLWECLYLGVVPVVEKVPQMYMWYADLPILWVNNFDKVTTEFLLAHYPLLKPEKSLALRDAASVSALRHRVTSELD